MPGAFTTHWKQKLFALGISALLWINLSGGGEASVWVVAPVQYRNLAKNLEFAERSQEEVRLNLRGPSDRLGSLTGAALPVVIDLGTVQGPGQRTFSVTRESLNLPREISLDRAIPGQIRVLLEPRATAMAPVAVRFANVPAGYRVADVLVAPASLEVYGPRNHVETLRQVETDPVDVLAWGARGSANTQAFAGDPQINFSGSPIVAVRFRVVPVNAAAPVR